MQKITPFLWFDGKAVEAVNFYIGISWQVVPKALVMMVGSIDTAAAQRATNAMMKMKKIDIAAMEQAYNNA